MIMIIAFIFGKGLFGLKENVREMQTLSLKIVYEIYKHLRPEVEATLRLTNI